MSDRPPPSAGIALPQLDALRGLAILAVYAQHVGDWYRDMVAERVGAVFPWAAEWVRSAFEHGETGVDLFFVVSGFSLALGFVADYDRGRAPDVRRFAWRRLVRIAPAFVVAIAIGAALDPRDLPARLATNALMLQGYFEPAVPPIIGAAWSLTTEVQFYALLPYLAPLVLAPMSIGRRVGTVAGIVGAAWASRAVGHALSLHPGEVTAGFCLATHRLVTSRVDEFVLGMLAAWLYTRWRDRPERRYAGVAMAACAVGLGVAWRLDSAVFLSPGGFWPYSLISLAMAGLVLAATLTAPRRRPALAPLEWLGLVSYGVFLYHQLALERIGQWIGVAPTWASFVPVVAGGLAGGVALGALSWYVVERPALRWAAGARRAPA